MAEPTILECISEALSLDSQGAPDKALAKYVESLGKILDILESPNSSESDRQQYSLLAKNCLERINALTSSSQQQSQRLHARKTSANIDASLSALRRLHEKEQLERIDHAASHAPHRRSPSLTKSDTQSYQKQSVFQQRVRELLSLREARLEQLLSGAKVLEWMKNTFSSFDLSTLTGGMLGGAMSSPSGSFYLSAVLSANDSSSQQSAILSFLVNDREHPVVQLADDFIRRLHHLLTEEPLQSTSDIADEIHLFSRHFTGWFEQQQCIGICSAAEFGLHEYIFGTGLYCMLMERYERDSNHHSNKIIEVGWEAIGRSLGLSDAFLSGLGELENFPVASDPAVLLPPISLFNQLPSARTPFAKISLLARSCSELCRAFPMVIVGGEDLMRLVALLVIRSPLGDKMASQAAFMADLVPEAVLRGEAGYALATLQSAIEFLNHL